MHKSKVKVKLGNTVIHIINYSLVTLRDNYIHFVTDCREVIKLVLPMNTLKLVLNQLEANKSIDLTTYLGTSALEYKSLLTA